MRQLLVALLFAAMMAMPVPSSATPQGCTVIATGHPDMPGTCTYVATGAGEYRVASGSGFRIEILEPAARKGTLVAKSAVPEAPQSGVVVQSGALATQPGDKVGVSITIGQSTVPVHGVLRYQDGYVTAGDTP